MPKEIHYTESKELKKLAEDLKAKYINVVGYVEIDKIFFAFKGGDVDANFSYAIQGLKNDWIKHTKSTTEEPKVYCISMSYDFYQKTLGSQQEWIMIECLYSCHPTMDGKLRRKNVHEFSRFLKTLEDIGETFLWRENGHLPSLLGDETIVFALEEDDSI